MRAAVAEPALRRDAAGSAEAAFLLGGDPVERLRREREIAAAAESVRLAGIAGTKLEPLVRRRLETALQLPPASEVHILDAKARRAALGLASGFARRPGREPRPFERALRGAQAGGRFASQPGRRFIFEIKAASPSEGLLRKSVDLEAYAQAFAGTADAVSVLTEPDFFGGSFERLAQCRRLMPQTPLLAKDIVVSPRQVLAAAAAGADAVLLMLSVLTEAGARRLARFAAELGLEVLYEAADETEIAAALRLGARMIGLNNRDFRTLRTDLARFRALAPLVPAGPTAPVLVCESGVKTHADLAALEAEAEARGAAMFARSPVYLVGSALSRASDLTLAARALLYGEAKVCGIASAADALEAAQAGASAVGIILAERSVRAVARRDAPALAREIRAKAAAAGRPLGIVLVDDCPASADAAADLAALAAAAELRAGDALQIHGFDPAALEAAAPAMKRLRAALDAAGMPETVELRLAFGLSALGEASRSDPEAAERFGRGLAALLDSGVIQAAVLDAGVGAQSGGTGRAFERTLLHAVPPAARTKCFAAGGVGPETAAALDRFGLRGLDFNSKVEAAPGRKDPAKLRAAFEALALGRRSARHGT